MAGGSDVTKYFVSGDFNNEHGVEPNNFQTQNNGRANLQATPTSKTDFSINAGYLQSRLDLPQNDNNEASAIAERPVGVARQRPVRHGYFVLITPAAERLDCREPGRRALHGWGDRQLAARRAG